MNHGKRDNKRRGDGEFRRQEEAPSRTESQAQREREAVRRAREAKGGLQEAFGHSHGQRSGDGQYDARSREAAKPERGGLSGSVVGDGNAGQAGKARGIGSADSPRASASNTDAGNARRQGSEQAGAGEEPFRDEPLPARLGDRDRRERQVSEPGAGFGDSEREQPHPGLRDVEGMARESDLGTRDEGGSRAGHDAARTGLNEQQERLGMADHESKETREKQASPGGYGYGGGRRDTPKDKKQHNKKDRSAKRESRWEQ